MKKLVLSLLWTLFLLFVPGVASAATRTVCASGCDATTIGGAVTLAASGDTITVATGTYTEALSLSKNLIIDGGNAATTIVQSSAIYAGATTASTFKINAGFTVTLKNMTVRHGWNGTFGGGVDNLGVGTLDGLIVEKNSANNGGGVANHGAGATLTIKNCMIRTNGPTVTGGGVYNVGVMTVQNTIVSGNSGGGGGIYSGTGGTTTILNSTISSNTSVGLSLSSTTVTAVNTTVSNNTSNSGIVVSASTLRMSHCTITGNDNPVATSGGGGIAFTNSPNIVQLKNTILAGNTRAGEPSDCDGKIDSYGGVLIGSLSECSMAIYGIDDVFEQPAGLDYLRNNGGPTPTHALLDDSPAIDAAPDCKDLDGATVTTDQRGVSRPQGSACDLGAYEADGSIPSNKFACWDLNENDVCNLLTEDQNEDGNCTPQDCQGEDGVACWDLNGDGTCNTGTEDFTGDLACNLIDCRGSAGAKGTACWDLNGNSACNVATEDINDDLICNVEDCQGAAGFSCWDLDRDYACDPSENKNMDADCTPADCNGTNGTNGTPGTTGAQGAPGAACWDTNGNGSCNLPGEDPSGDNQCNFIDCRGTAGADGYACWDLNQNHACDPSEDETGDVACSVADCQGKDGYTCWDLDTDYICDPNEDTNEDTFCTVADCLGPMGPQGPVGVTCWDLNGNQACDDTTEDLDGDDDCTLADCQGASGLDGFTCWDLNNNRICDPSEDENADTQCNVLDCRGQDGADGENGADGVSCWDTSADGVCDPDEDVNGDDACDVFDCAGIDGISALTHVSDEPSGSHCAAGGTKIETGIDLDGDQLLSESEVQDTQYSCNGLALTPKSGDSSGEDGGCGCRSASSSARSTGAWLVLLAGSLLLQRRRRAQRLETR